MEIDANDANKLKFPNMLGKLVSYIGGNCREVGSKRYQAALREFENALLLTDNVTFDK